MNSYRDLTSYFGLPLADTTFQSYIKSTFIDLADYNIANGDYIISEKSGIELGFINNEAVVDEDDCLIFEKGNPIFSHVNIYPKSSIKELPLEVNFADSRTQVINKAGQPTQTSRGDTSFFGRAFLVDNYKVGELIITFDYEPEKENINFIQIRDNNLVAHLKL